jgi:hypothetical protein
MKLEMAKSTNFKQPRVTSLRRERKKLFQCPHGRLPISCPHFYGYSSGQHKGSFGIWGFFPFGCFSVVVLAENDVTDIMGV